MAETVESKGNGEWVAQGWRNFKGMWWLYGWKTP